jgi:hypothetical protein
VVAVTPAAVNAVSRVIPRRLSSVSAWLRCVKVFGVGML